MGLDKSKLSFYHETDDSVDSIENSYTGKVIVKAFDGGHPWFAIYKDVPRVESYIRKEDPFTGSDGKRLTWISNCFSHTARLSEEGIFDVEGSDFEMRDIAWAIEHKSIADHTRCHISYHKNLDGFILTSPRNGNGVYVFINMEQAEGLRKDIEEKVKERDQ